jgi:hypothetical protein
MALSINDLLAQSNQETIGIAKESSGEVIIQSSDAQPVQIQTSSSATAIQVNDDATINLNLGTSVNEIVNSFDAATPNKDQKLTTVRGVYDFWLANGTGLNNIQFETKAAFDAYVFVEAETPAFVFVSDPVQFSYTDNDGVSVTNVNSMFLYSHWHDGAIEHHLIVAGTLTNAEIKTAYEANADTNAFTDAEKSKVANVPADTNNELSTINTTLSDKASISSVNTFTAQQNFVNTAGAQLYTQNTTGDLSAIGHKGTTNNFRAGSGYDDTNDHFFVKVGNQSNFPDLPNRLEITTTNADFKVNLQQNGNDVVDITGAIFTGKVETGDQVKITGTTPLNKRRFQFTHDDGKITNVGALELNALNDSDVQIGQFRFENDSFFGTSSGLFTNRHESAAEQGAPINLILSGNNLSTDKPGVSFRDGGTANGLVDAYEGNTRAQIYLDKSDSNKIKFSHGSDASATAVLPTIFEYDSDGIALSGKDIKLTNPGTGFGRLRFANTNASANQKEYEIQARSGNYLELETNNDSDVAQNSFKFYHNGNFELDGTITQNSNAVLDSSDIVNNINGAANTLSDNPTLKAYIDANAGNFDGGTITNPLTIETDVNNSSLLILKRTDNGLDQGVAWQNSGSGFTKAIYQDSSDSDKLKIVSGASADSDINNLTEIVQISNSAVGVFTDLVVGSGGSISATGITSTAGVVAFEDIEIKNGKLVGRKVTSHANRGNENFNFGSLHGTNLTGMKILSSWDGTYNDEEISFYTHNGGSSAGERMLIDKDGNTRILKKLAIGADTTPLNALDVYGALYVTGGALFKSSITIEDTSDNDYNFEARASGVGLRAVTNPAAGEPIFTVESSGNSQRLRVEHSGAVTTSNAEIRVATGSDGTGGNVVLHEGNWQEKSTYGEYYFQSFPTLTDAIMKAWAGKSIYFFGTGVGTINLPEIVASGASSSQVNAGTRFTLHNFNTAADITIVAHTGQKLMVDNVDSNNISPAGGSAAIRWTSSIDIVAVDLRTYTQVNAFCWAFTGIRQ